MRRDRNRGPVLFSTNNADTRSMREGDLALKSENGFVYLYTKKGEKLYRAEMSQPSLDTNVTEKEAANKGFLKKAQEINKGFVVSISGYALPTSTSSYYRTLMGNEIAWTTAETSLNIDDYDFPQCNFISSVPVILRECKASWSYLDAVMDDAEGFIYVRKMTRPASGSTGATITSEAMKTIPWYSAQNNNTLYTSDSTVSRTVTTSELDAGDGVMVFIKRTDGSSARIYVNVSLHFDFI